MLIWLPPSEGKLAPTAGPALGPLSFPELSSARAEVAEALIRVSASPEAGKILGLGPKSVSEAAANLELWTGPCAPAAELYTGVLYANLLPYPAAFPTSTWIFSGLFGVVRPGDYLPNHRLSMNVSLPGLGPLATWWRDRLLPLLPEGETIVDARSGPYRRALPARSAHVIEVHPPAGVSHQAKAYRGQVARYLLERLPAEAGLAETLACLESVCELGPTKATAAGGSLTQVRAIRYSVSSEM
ncbi:YaaA family protein [Scrofimicrobium sp. R131]|uniref:Peroxide stress protein YaaA n=1 Tax=Scrofimicrobium appendicitidis TaxID=3079930 RepID=A0AAU7V997_9ACTO